jgi:plasmid stabilization system protein ParE
VNVRLSARARREVTRIDENWRSAADHKNLFADELEAKLAKLADAPNLGPIYDAGTPERIFRTRLERSQYFVYYTHSGDDIVVLSVWSALRGRQPRL